jgi:hypothetical protein
MSARRRYTVVVSDPAEQARFQRGARLLHKSMSAFFRTAARAYLDLVEKGLEAARREKARRGSK